MCSFIILVGLVSDLNFYLPFIFIYGMRHKCNGYLHRKWYQKHNGFMFCNNDISKCVTPIFSMTAID